MVHNAATGIERVTIQGADCFPDRKLAGWEICVWTSTPIY